MNKNKTVACYICDKNITTLQSITNKCKCTYIFCSIHKFPENHMCSFNYKHNYQSVLSSNMPVIKGEKINQI